MAGFNEIDRVRTPKGQYVSASPLGGSGRPKRAIDAVPVPLVLVVVALFGLRPARGMVGDSNERELFVLASAHGRGNGRCRHAHLLFLRLSASCELHDASAYRERGAHFVAAFARHWRREQRRAKLGQIGIQLQPGEFAKITVILLDAAVMSKFGGRLDDPREFIKALAYIAIPFLCIMTQPDLGTGLVYLVIGAVTLIMGGARWKYLIVLLGVFVGLIVAVFAVDEVLKNATGEYVLLQQYQRNRLLVFLDPSADVTGTGFNLNQAMIAIGSGGLFGKGLLNGSQSSLGFVPESATDFIFCVLAGAVRLYGRPGASRAVFGAHSGSDSHRARVERFVRDAHRDGHCGHVALPDSREYRHGHWTYAHYGHSVAVHELRIVVHDGELRAARPYWQRICA